MNYQILVSVWIRVLQQILHTRYSEIATISAYSVTKRGATTAQGL